jgi:hypothetical protein
MKVSKVYLGLRESEERGEGRAGSSKRGGESCA